MDYETKLILERLIEAINNNQVDLEQLVNAINNSDVNLEPLVKAVNSPDWWSIGITAVNAVIVIVLTIWQLCLNKRQTQIQERQNELQEYQTQLQLQQNELQKRQIETQEYEMYRRLYIVVGAANYEIKSFLYNIWSALWAPTYKIDKRYLQHRREDVENVQKEFIQNVVDFELKFSTEFFDRVGYDRLLSYMASIYKHMENHYMNNMFPLIDGTHTMHYDPNKGDDSYIAAIMMHFPTKEMSDLYCLYMSEFVNLKQQIYDAEALNKIKARCKIE